MKTPEQQEAQELINMFRPLVHKNYNSIDDGELKRSKLCALICVNKIIKETNGYSDLVSEWQDDKEYKSVIERLEFYKKVKQLIIDSDGKHKN